MRRASPSGAGSEIRGGCGGRSALQRPAPRLGANTRERMSLRPTEARLPLAAAAADPRLVAQSHVQMATLALTRGQHDRAAELLDSARRGFEAVGAGDDAIAAVLTYSGSTAHARGALTQALQRF